VKNLESTRLAVVGTGLIGASVGLAAKRAGAARVAGFDPDAAALALAVERRAIDTPAESLETAVAEAELVVVAAPVGAIVTLLSGALAANGGCTATDVGSTKARICSTLASESRFVGGHPLAGSETRGAGGARADLFDGSAWFLTPTPETDPDRYRFVRDVVGLLGAEAVAIDPEAHDLAVGLTSHLPHAVANVLANQVGAAGDHGLRVPASLRDMTRIAGANPELWAEIFLDNARNLGDALADHRRRIDELEELLRRGDADALSAWIEDAARNRPR
jgi:prephenate dehydrogenase